MNESKAPFAIGQKVVFVKPDIPGVYTVKPKIQKGNVYTVDDIEYTRSGWDKGWYIGVTADPETVYAAELFAPYDPPRLEIPAELLEVDTKDGIYVIKEKELV